MIVGKGWVSIKRLWGYVDGEIKRVKILSYIVIRSWEVLGLVIFRLVGGVISIRRSLGIEGCWENGIVIVGRGSFVGFNFLKGVGLV